MALAPRLEAVEVLKAELGFGGYTVPGRWAPLWIEREGGGSDARVEVRRLAAEGRAMGFESYPLPEGQRIECPVFVEGALALIVVTLREAEGVLAETRLEAQGRSFPGHVALACGLPLRSRLALGSALLPAEPIQVVAVDLGQLPANALDYDGVSALALEDQGPLLSPAQGSALLAWIAGGGRLLISSAGPGSGALLASLGLAAAAEKDPDAAYSSTPLGLGWIVRTTRDLSARPQAEGPGFWRRALSLAPYGSLPRIAEGSFAGKAAAREEGDPVAQRARVALVAAVVLWMAAAVAVALLARGRAWPAAALALISLGLVLLGRPSIDRALRQGSSARLIALLLEAPGADAAPASGAGRGFALVRAIISGARPAPAFEWVGAGAVRSLAVDFKGEEELVAQARPGSQPEWRHALPRSGLSLRSEGRDGLALSGLVDLEALGVSRRGPLAYLEKGGLLWERLPGAAWTRSESPPKWLAGDLDWIRDMGRKLPDRGLLIGRDSAPGLGLRVALSPLRDLLWLLPLEGGPPR